MNDIKPLNHTVQLTLEWLDELKEIGDFAGEEQAYSALRAVSHALRDRLTVDEAAHLGAQLPMLVRGFYFEGWAPASTPKKIRSKPEFLEYVKEKMSGGTNLEPDHAVRAVFALLDRRITPGEIEDVRDMLPAELQELWPDTGT